MGPIRIFDGVKPKLAMELTGFHGSSKTFRTKFRDSEDKTHKLYSAHEIRHIRMQLLGITQAARGAALGLPPIVVARMAKGGVGKTTTTGNLASGLALSGYRVLLIDGDPQASLTGMFGIDWTQEQIVHVGELMRRCSRGEPVDPQDAVRSIYAEGMLDLIPADITMADDTWLVGAMNRELSFQRLLEKEAEFFNQYDVIVVDSSPGASLLATTFMVAAKTLLAVVSPEGQSLAALDVLASNVGEINSAFGRNEDNMLDIHIVCNRYNQSKKPHSQCLAKLLTSYPNKLDDTIVRDFIGFLREVDPDNLHLNGPVLEKEPNSIGARDIIALTHSLIRRYDIRLAGVSAFASMPTNEKEEVAA